MSSVPDQLTGGHELLDVMNIPLVDLASSQETALGSALRRIRREAEAPPENLSAFGSYVE
jgi:FXSXX-COOH protein